MSPCRKLYYFLYICLQMKKLIVILFVFISSFGFSQYFVPFGEDSIYRASGVHSSITSLYVDDTVMYIGGGGVQYGGGWVLLNEIGMWDNNNWHSLNNGLGNLNGEIHCFQKYNHRSLFYFGNEPQCFHL